MANTHWLKKPVAEQVQSFAADASLGIDIGDLMYLDTNDAKPASSQSDAGSEAANQATFAPNFVGVANSARLSTDADAGEVRVQVDGLYEFACASATFEIGDLIGIDENDAGDGLHDQRVTKVTQPHLAIGVVTQRYASATTKVWGRIISRKAWDLGNRPSGFFGQGTGVNVETLAGNKTLTIADAPIQVLDPDGARNVVLPAEAISAGRVFFIHNAAGGAEVITIQDDAAGTVCTPTQNETAIVYCDGTTWRGIVGANN